MNIKRNFRSNWTTFLFNVKYSVFAPIFVCVFCVFQICFFVFVQSYEVEKQEVIELPVQSDYVPWTNKVDENPRSTPPPLINKDDTPQNDALESNTEQLDVRFGGGDDENNK